MQKYNHSSGFGGGKRSDCEMCWPNWCQNRNELFGNNKFILIIRIDGIQNDRKSIGTGWKWLCMRKRTSQWRRQAWKHKINDHHAEINYGEWNMRWCKMWVWLYVLVWVRAPIAHTHTHGRPHTIWLKSFLINHSTRMDHLSIMDWHVSKHTYILTAL